ncbi:MAG: YbaK/EbsC family protein [Candidatus Omnitrophica bacterium]|nr:YbaK/EbsC family protein [Candidatus Omnitrophota bacterium]MCB9746932.1 YbaK/EbsC family protein [Candidatus Omnitrophota bacterium]
MPIKKLKKYLDEHKIKYVSFSHSTAYTGQEIAEAAHISGKELVKAVILKVDNELAMVVLPVSFRIDFDLLKQSLNAEKIELATEDEFIDWFPDCEIGAMPPFGNLYGIPVFVANRLEEQEMITFNAGNHRELIQMRFHDYKRLVNPQMVDMTFVSVYF